MILLRTAITVAGIGLALGSAPAFGQQAAPAPEALPPDVEVVEGRAIVRFLPGTQTAAIDRVLRAAAVEVERPLGLDDAFEVRFPEDRDPRDVARALSAQPGVKWAEPDVYGEVAGVPDDPEVVPADADYGDQWGLKAIEGPLGWGVAESPHGAVVAVIDSGLDYEHPQLKSTVVLNPGESDPALRHNGQDDDGNGYVDDWRGFDFGEHDADATDSISPNTKKGEKSRGHGTMAAGIIAAHGDGTSVSGVIRRDARILPVKVIRDNGRFTASRVAEGITFARRHGAKVANVSLSVGSWTHSIADAIDEAPGMLVVAASGNDGGDLYWRAVYPCEDNSANVVCVGSHDADGGRSWFSNYGEEVDLSAPGNGILTTDIEADGGTVQVTGTSLSAPFVAGAAALVYGMDAWLPQGVFTPTDVREVLMHSAVKEPGLQGASFTGARLDLFAAFHHLPLQRPGVATGSSFNVGYNWAGINGSVSHEGINLTHVGAQWRVKGQPETTKESWWLKSQADLDAVDGGVSYSMGGLAEGTTYEYRFVAKNPFGLNGGAAWKTFTTPKHHYTPSGPGGIVNPPKPTHGPEAPGGLSAG